MSLGGSGLEGSGSPGAELADGVASGRIIERGLPASVMVVDLVRSLAGIDRQLAVEGGVRAGDCLDTVETIGRVACSGMLTRSAPRFSGPNCGRSMRPAMNAEPRAVASHAASREPATDAALPKRARGRAVSEAAGDRPLVRQSRAAIPATSGSRVTHAEPKRPPANQSETTGFEAALDRELLRAEDLRLRLLFLTSGATFVATLMLWLLTGGGPELNGGEVPGWLIPAVAFGVTIYPLMALRGLRRLDRSHPRGWWSYFTAAMELCLPGSVIVLLGWYGDAETALGFPVVHAYAVLLVLFVLRLDPWLPVAGGAFVGFQLLALWWWLAPEVVASASPLAAQHQWARALLVLVNGAAAGLVAREYRGWLTRILKTQEERNHVVGLFGRHVSPEVVDALLAQRQELASEMRYVCVMFLDIRSFTRLAEHRSPVEVVELLNGVFQFMIEAVNEHHGIINKFLGDGFMAVFGAPLSDGRDCENAVACALELLERLQREKEAGRVPEELRIGMGLHAGEVVTGSIGSERRKEYTVIGDVVNVAARLEAMNKRFGSQILVSEEVWRVVQARGVTGESLGPVEVAGRGQAVGVVRLA